MKSRKENQIMNNEKDIKDMLTLMMNAVAENGKNIEETNKEARRLVECVHKNISTMCESISKMHDRIKTLEKRIYELETKQAAEIQKKANIDGIKEKLHEKDIEQLWYRSRREVEDMKLSFEEIISDYEKVAVMTLKRHSNSKSDGIRSKIILKDMKTNEFYTVDSTGKKYLIEVKSNSLIDKESKDADIPFKDLMIISNEIENAVTVAIRNISDDKSNDIYVKMALTDVKTGEFYTVDDAGNKQVIEIDAKALL